jgi:hypothetical protein
MKKILDIIKYILIVVTMILIIVFQNKIYNVFLVISVFCFILGIIHIIEKKRTWILLELLSLTSLISIILYKKDILDFGDTITFYMCLLLSTTLLSAIIVLFIDKTKNNKKYTMEVTAKVIDYEKVENTKIQYVYPIYSYFVDKKEYCVISPILYKKKFPEIDSELTIYVNPKDPGDIFFKPSNVRITLYLISAIFSIIACIVIIINLLK